jgi:hypothetical protein
MKKLFLALILSLSFIGPFAVSSVVFAFDPLDPACEAKVGSGGADDICKHQKAQ